jgi:peptidoglycan/xylan/chitin deacetylase (PgdA/CDA1 family)
VSLTFDDGYRDALTVAGPILERYQLPFTVFVVSGFLARPPASVRALEPCKSLHIHCAAISS